MAVSRRDFLSTAGAGCLLKPAGMRDPAATPAQREGLDKGKVADAALTAAKELGASYADIRINRYRRESISTRERQVQSVSRSESFGLGVRVLVKGAWGFSSSRVVTPESARKAAEEAVETARANGQFQRKRVELVSTPKVATKWKSAFEKDPFEVSVEEKIQFLMRVNEAAMRVKGVSFVNSRLSFVNEQKYLATSDGCRIEQYIIRSFPSFSVTAVNREAGDFQSRDSFGGPQQMGYEYLTRHDWLKEAEQAGEEAVQKLKAKPVAPGKYDLVLHPTHLWLTIHESVGHPTELDRALWWEANYAGTSFLTPEKAGKLRFGSKLVNFFADRVQPSGLATVGYDDEGVPGQKWSLVKEGMFTDWQTTRDLAPLIGRKKSYGCLCAESWEDVPFPRMPNVSLKPGKQNVSLDQLLADVDNGILIYGNGSYSIDQQRYNFQFGGQTFWEVKRGKVAGMLRDAAYQSRTTDFWGSLDALGGPLTYEIHGSFSDGKGEPGQSNSVSHGCPPARFRGVNVLDTKG